MSDDFEREERAFAEALRASAEAESFRPLDAGQVTRAGSARARVPAWGRGVAAAAAAVVVIGGLAFALSHLGGSAASSSVAAAPAPAAAGGAEQAPGPSPAGVSDDTAAASPPAWSEVAGSPLSPRSDASGTWFDGRFYLVGGQLDRPCPPNAGCLAPTQVLRDGASYEPATGTWRRIADAPVPLEQGPAIVVGERLYYQVGYGQRSRVYAYEPATDAWSAVATPRGLGTLVAAGDRLVSIHAGDEEAGGFDERYDAAADRWTRLPDDPLGPSFGRDAVWVDGVLLLTAHDLVANPGSERPSVLRLAELDLDALTWRLLPDSEVLTGGGVAVGDLVVFGGLGSADGGAVNNWGRSYPMGGLYDARTGAWSDLPPLDASEGVKQSWRDASLAGDRVLTSGHLLDPAARAWTVLSPPPPGNLEGQTVVTGPAGILVFGGWDGAAQTAGTAYLPLR